MKSSLTIALTNGQFWRNESPCPGQQTAATSIQTDRPVSVYGNLSAMSNNTKKSTRMVTKGYQPTQCELLKTCSGISSKISHTANNQIKPRTEPLSPFANIQTFIENKRVAANTNTSGNTQSVTEQDQLNEILKICSEFNKQHGEYKSLQSRREAAPGIQPPVSLYEGDLSLIDNNAMKNKLNEILKICSGISLKISHTAHNPGKGRRLLECFRSGIKIGRTHHNTHLINNKIIRSAKDFTQLLAKLRGNINKGQALQLREQLNELKENQRRGNNEEVAGTALTYRAFANAETVFSRRALVTLRNLRTLCRDKGEDSCGRSDLLLKSDFSALISPACLSVAINEYLSQLQTGPRIAPSVTYSDIYAAFNDQVAADPQLRDEFQGSQMKRDITRHWDNLMQWVNGNG